MEVNKSMSIAISHHTTNDNWQMVEGLIVVGNMVGISGGGIDSAEPGVVYLS